MHKESKTEFFYVNSRHNKIPKEIPNHDSNIVIIIKIKKREMQRGKRMILNWMDLSTFRQSKE